MVNLLDRIDEIGATEGERPYLPFLSAIDTGLVDAECVAADFNEPIGVAIANGRIPNSQGAGVVRLRDGTVVGIDHLHIERWGKHLITRPTSKDHVDHAGHFIEPGAVVMTTAEGPSAGWMKVVALVVNRHDNPWLVDAWRRKRPQSVSKAGDMAVLMAGIDAPTYRYEVSTDSGEGWAAPRTQLF